jgi:Mce-associated membrane protein
MTEQEVLDREEVAPVEPPAPERGVVNLVLAGLTAVALLVAGWFGVSWWNAAHDEGAALATDRDTAILAGQQAITNFNTLDYRDMDGGLDRWERSATGALLDQIRAGRVQSGQAIRAARTTTTGRVVQAALPSFDDQGGKAQIIAVVETIVTPENAAPVTKRNRFLGELTRADSGWKLSALQTVAIGQ